ncbi:uncharacterized protein LOC108219171 isoform X2 [Daucus carota subsp. sativus]|uniref:uncharacterized protein LOC108219171 isoform X2 n=2 Tax=Daucus carota subsp. sativus TaxID=79200 RepID=UPI00308316A5
MWFPPFPGLMLKHQRNTFVSIYTHTDGSYRYKIIDEIHILMDHTDTRLLTRIKHGPGVETIFRRQNIVMFSESNRGSTLLETGRTPHTVIDQNLMDQTMSSLDKGTRGNLSLFVVTS